MTHDDLLIKLDEIWNGEKITTKAGLSSSIQALRAVVEMHKPKGNFADTYINGEPNSPYCPECVDPDIYPCPTIQAIEKELK